MHVLATAGHVDHGKSALVRALTGIEPDRWEEEHRRGLTIDLGYAWTQLPTGEQVAFVDVPGHERFIGNMLAGLGPVPAVVFVVAADEGWRQQSGEHLAAIDALGVAHGLLVVTRSDLADPAPALVDGSARLAASSLGAVEALAVSARTGEGMDALRAALSRLVAALPAPRRDGRTRLWVDRAFSIRGSGTVVTGTLGEGSLAAGDRVEVGGRVVGVRGLESLEQPVQTVSPVCRVAANLRGLTTADVARGDVLLTPGAWRLTHEVDIRLRRPLGTDGGSSGSGEWPEQVVVHVGSAAVSARLRPLGDDTARLALTRALPLVAGDRVIVRDPGTRLMVGALVLDADPPALGRRGAASRRTTELETYDGTVDLQREVTRRGAMRAGDARALGAVVPADAGAATASTPGAGVPQGDSAHGIRAVGSWLVADEALHAWATALGDALTRRALSHPLDPTLSLDAVHDLLDLPDRSLVAVVAELAGLEVTDGRVGVEGARPHLGPAEAGLRAMEERLGESPFAAPERGDLAEAGLGKQQLAAAERAGRLVRLGDDVVLLPDGPTRAMRVLAGLPQPFTLSAARRALGTTRRVAVPLLEHLDRRGWTRRVDDSYRIVVR